MRNIALFTALLVSGVFVVLAISPAMRSGPCADAAMPCVIGVSSSVKPWMMTCAAVSSSSRPSGGDSCTSNRSLEDIASAGFRFTTGCKDASSCDVPSSYMSDAYTRPGEDSIPSASKAAAKLQLDTIQTTVSDSESSATWCSGNVWFDDKMSKAVMCSAKTRTLQSGDASVKNAVVVPCINAFVHKTASHSENGSISSVNTPILYCGYGLTASGAVSRSGSTASVGKSASPSTNDSTASLAVSGIASVDEIVSHYGKARLDTIDQAFSNSDTSSICSVEKVAWHSGKDSTTLVSKIISHSNAWADNGWLDKIGLLFDGGLIASSGTVNSHSGSISLVDKAVSHSDSTASIDKAVASSGDGSTASVHKPVSHNGSIGKIVPHCGNASVGKVVSHTDQGSISSVDESISHSDHDWTTSVGKVVWRLRNVRFGKAVMHFSNSSTASVAISSAMHDRPPRSHGCNEGTANATPRRATGAALTMHATRDGVLIARNDRSATSH
jgi:hypothetical protein